MTAPDLDKLPASPHWEWRPGMRNTDGEMVIATSRGLRLAACDGLALDQITDDRPDIDHGGTQGEMLALVRKAWGPGVTISNMDGPRGCSTTITNSGGFVVFRTTGAPLGHRLAAALLAAPPPA